MVSGIGDEDKGIRASLENELATVVATDPTVRPVRSPSGRSGTQDSHANRKRRSTMLARLMIVAAMLLGFAATVYAACPLCP